MISKSRIEKYSRTLDALKTFSTQGLAAELRPLVDGMLTSSSETSRSFFRDEITDKLFATLSLNAAASQELAARLCEEIAESEGFKLSDVVMSEVSFDSVSDRVHDLMQCAYGEKQWTSSMVASAMERYAYDSTSDYANGYVENRVSKSGGNVRYARVSAFGEPCGFCFMLSSRGFEYKSANGAGDGHKFHSGCRCVVIPGVFKSTSISGYNFKDMRNRFNTCRQTVEDSARRKYKSMTNDERKRAGSVEDYIRTQTFKECEMRSTDWLYFGKEPDITFETEWLKEEKLKPRYEHEIKTAERIRKHGFEVDFAVDEIHNKDGSNTGLADFLSGVELKSLRTASTFNAVDGYLKNAAKKMNASAIIFDNVDNDGLSDTALAEMILKSRRFKNGRVYILGKDESLELVR